MPFVVEKLMEAWSTRAQENRALLALRYFVLEDDFAGNYLRRPIFIRKKSNLCYDVQLLHRLE